MRRTAILLCMAAGLAAQGGAQQTTPDRGEAYYNYAMGHLYTELAAAYSNRSEYLNEAIDHLKSALKADPEASFVADELADLYIQSGRLREGATEAEASLRDNPNDLNAHRILGRIYARLVGDTQAGKINEDMLARAIEQYAKVVELEPQDVRALLMLGRLYKIDLKAAEAQKAFEAALDLDPSSTEAMTGLALVYTDLGDHERAAALLQRVAAQSPDARTFVSLAASYEQLRDYESASNAFRRAAELAPGNVELKRALAQSLLMAGKLDESLTLYEELSAQDPSDVQALLRIAQISRDRNDYAKARAAIDKAKTLQPDNVEILFTEVGLLEAELREAEAIDTLKEVLAATQRDSYSRGEAANRAILLERLGLLQRSFDQTDEAVATFRELGKLGDDYERRASAQIIDALRQASQFERALQEVGDASKKYPDDRLIATVRVSLLADLQRTDEAVAEVQKLFDGANDRETYLVLAQVYEKAKRWDEMAGAIDSAERLSSTPEEKQIIYFTRGAMFERMKKIPEAEAEFRKVLAGSPDSASALNYLGYMLADRDMRLNEALSMIERAVAQEPNNGAYLDSLGWVYYRLGRFEEAEPQLRRAIPRSGQDPTVHDHLGEVYIQQGKLKEAIQEWEAAIRLWEAGAPADLDADAVEAVRKKVEAGRVRLAREQAAGVNRQ